MNKELNDTIHFPCGRSMKNRFMLAPMTNSQSYENGHLSEDELHWLTMRAKGQFGMVMTCAAHVQEIGKGFPGQLGIFSDTLIDDHKKLTSTIKSYDSLVIIQLHHAGMRTPHHLIDGKPVCPSDNSKFDARGLSLEEVKTLRDDFINAGIRAYKSGYDGVEIHGAHGYILTQFLSKEINHREDEYGGSLENRARLIYEIADGIRNACGKEFIIGVRLSPERYGMNIQEIKTVSQKLIDHHQIDFLDISVWNYKKYPEEESMQDLPLIEHFFDIDYKDVLLTMAGKIYDGTDVYNVLNKRVDFVGIGKAGILHHDFPQKVMDNKSFISTRTPVSEAYLSQEGLSEKFITYMKRWEGFVES